ncbi:MAG: porin family protein [Gammaproteobacteria bacterium]|nr:porin family protein [Gammaproteobacteria bacterium]
MKKPLVVVASGAFLGLAAAPAIAQETPSESQFVDYVTAQLVWADVDAYDEALALAIAAGKTVAPNFSVEGELTTTITEAEAEAAGSNAETTYWSVGAYGVYALPVGEDFALRGRLGGVYLNVDQDVGGLDGDEFNVSFGVGGLYDLSPNLNLIAEYTRLDADINHLSAGVQFKF